jgi:hypothetical protein
MDWEQAGCETIPEMAAHYVREMKAVQPSGPYRLLGDSFGGLIVFEMALQLQREGDAVELLAMVDTSPPGCLTEDGLDLVPSPANVGASPRVSDSHLRARRSYVLDVRLEQNRLRGALTYFVCDGNPIIAGSDPRRLWQEFAPDGFRLLHLPGLHGYTDIDPQRSALQRQLRDLIEGRPVPFSTPDDVFKRSYRIEGAGHNERVVGSAGDLYRVQKNHAQGCVEQLHRNIDTIHLVGWAVEPNQQDPAQRIAVFMGGLFIGYGASGEVRYDIARRQGTLSALGAGFNFCFDRHAVGQPQADLRLFVLSNDRATELPFAIQSATLANTDDALAASQIGLASSPHELMRLQAELARLRRSLHDIEQSTSWRVTAPIRALRHAYIRWSGRK